MIFTALAFLFVSALCHAAWNILAKRACDKFTFLWLQMVVNVMLLAVPFLLLSDLGELGKNPAIFISGILQTVYYLLLSKTYTIGDIEVVYPLTRGSAPVFVALFSTLLGLEPMTLPIFASILTIVFGIYTVNLEKFSKSQWIAPFKVLAKNPSTRFSLLLGVVIAIYTLVDKRNVSSISPFTVFYMITLIPMLLLTPGVIKRGKIKNEVRQNKAKIIVVACLTFLSYLLVLVAMREGNASFISPVREISVLFVAFYMVATGKEKNWIPKLVGCALIFAGIVSLSVFTALQGR